MDHKKPYFYLITFLLVIAVTIFFDYLVGLANDTKTNIDFPFSFPQHSTSLGRISIVLILAFVHIQPRTV